MVQVKKQSPQAPACNGRYANRNIKRAQDGTKTKNSFSFIIKLPSSVVRTIILQRIGVMLFLKSIKALLPSTPAKQPAPLLYQFLSQEISIY